MPDREGPCQNLEGGKNPKAPGEAVAVAANPVLKTVETDAPSCRCLSSPQSLRKEDNMMAMIKTCLRVIQRI